MKTLLEEPHELLPCWALLPTRRMLARRALHLRWHDAERSPMAHCGLSLESRAYSLDPDARLAELMEAARVQACAGSYRRSGDLATRVHELQRLARREHERQQRDLRQALPLGSEGFDAVTRAVDAAMGALKPAFSAAALRGLKAHVDAQPDAAHLDTLMALLIGGASMHVPWWRGPWGRQAARELLRAKELLRRAIVNPHTPLGACRLRALAAAHLRSA
jgi:hypothetical protein